ncbi:MAG TPA: hypothetical protein VD704_10325 [Gaiellaceae bacterium]|nr:hypothetical protein [Gaiellaceae bacterium]
MATTTRDRTDDIRALEELWAAPAAVEPEPVPRPRRPALPQVPGTLLAGAWIAFFLVVFSLQPDPEPGMTYPAWVVGFSYGIFGLLLAAAAFGPLFSRLGFALAGAAGPLLIALAVNCRASEHHLGNWWLAELGAALALTGLAAAGLAQRLRRQ